MDQFPHFTSYLSSSPAPDHQRQADVTATTPPSVQPAPGVQPNAYANATAVPGQSLLVPVAPPPGWAATLSQLPLLNAGTKRDEPDSGLDPQDADNRKRARTAADATQVPMPPQPMPPFQPFMVLALHDASYWLPPGYGLQLVVCPPSTMHTTNPLIPPPAMQGDTQGSCGEDTTEVKPASAKYRAQVVDIAQDDYEPPELAAAAEYKEIEHLMTLLRDPNIDVNDTDHVGRSALHHATEGYSLAMVRMLLARPDINVNVKNCNGNTALIQAVMLETWSSPSESEDPPSEADVAINASNASNAKSTSVCGKDYPEDFEGIVLALLAAPGLDISVKNSASEDEPGFNTLTTIAAQNEVHIFPLVLPVLAMPNIDVNADVDSDTALIISARVGNDALVRMLLAMPGIDVNARNKDGKSALLEAREALNKNTNCDPAPYLRAIEMLTNHSIPTRATALDVRDLLRAIFTTHYNAPQQACSSSSAASDIVLSNESAMWLDDVCARLQFGECRTSEVPMLFASIASLPVGAQSTFARALAFGACTGHFCKANGALDEKIAAVIAKAGLREIFDDTLGKLQRASENIDLYRVDDMNLLGIAASEGNIGMLRGLAKLGAWTSLPSPNGKTALAIAVQHKQWDACTQLVTDGALPMLPLHDGYPALYHIGIAFCADAHATPSLSRLMYCLQQKNVPFDIPIKNPDAYARMMRPTVMLDELLETKLRS
ncbi:ankyrin repeat domain-containing protein [Noviherbaspirillum pedocola]|uniref:Ankyrin repeat domain-containing protein n=1 Tax=Noviherbaspirillum pedocola TaxID=2801341 RepID=A0A934T324_9BURK|nr:ankyrin repeat domain-containing protein [Noviherbaspirillum pedocola]MBK4738842.1 ankyrin repeat domain-containing protein [Noviherbaspirillum pedocola]